MKKLMKVMLASSLLLLIMNVTVVRNARAETRVLIIPGHYWSDGIYRPTMKYWFYDNPISGTGNKQCAWWSRFYHTSSSGAPLYSMCSGSRESVLVRP